MILKRIVRTALQKTQPQLIGQLRQWQVLRAYRRAGVVFIHIAKAGGTSICQSLFDQPVGHQSILQIRKSGAEDVCRLPAFTVVRNPWDRLYSAWNHARLGGGSDTDVAIRFDYGDPAFESFDRFILDWLSCRDDFDRLDKIFRPQAWFVGGREGVPLFSHIGRLEDLAGTRQWIEQHTGRRIALEHRNQTSPPANRIEVSSEAMEVVTTLYGEDFQLFGYAVELPSRFQAVPVR